jgi:hypothetical protein
MADDRSLKDVIRFVDPSGDMSDADIASISKDLKFTEVLDLITYVGKDDLDSARNILAKYDQRFTVAQEYSTVPTANKSQFKSIKPVGTAPTIAGKPTNPNGSQQGSEDQDSEDLNTLMTDPATKNKPEVRQIQSLLQRMKR